MSKELSKIADELASNISELVKSRVWRANVSLEKLKQAIIKQLKELSDK